MFYSRGPMAPGATVIINVATDTSPKIEYAQVKTLTLNSLYAQVFPLYNGYSVNLPFKLAYRVRWVSICSVE